MQGIGMAATVGGTMGSLGRVHGKLQLGRVHGSERRRAPLQRCRVRHGSRWQQEEVAAPGPVERSEPEDNTLPFYRKHTEALLRKYLRMSMEVGRVPSCLPREMFRGSVTAYRVRSFEDCVIFVHDMERCLGILKPAACLLLTRVVLQEYTQQEAAVMTGISWRQVARQYGEAVDQLTGLLLSRGLLKRIGYESCQ
jgi:hypothetical protein